MDSERKPIIFAEGIYKVKKINDKMISAIFKVDDFYSWAKQHKSPKGYVTINFCQSSQSEMWYPRLNTYTGKQLSDMEYKDYQQKQSEKPHIDLKANNIPF